MAIPLGTRFGRYEIRSLLGAGGMGEVYLADDLNLHRRVAIKVLSADLTTNKDRRQRFEREAFTASSLNHPNILTIYEIGSEKEFHFIATEFIDGESLGQHLRRESFSLPEVLEIGIQVAAALAAAHAAGIVHRDIKPDNIMLRRDRVVKVLDFGLAKLSEPEISVLETEVPTKARPLTTPGIVIGTARYMSPEQARGLPVDARTDIWSLGVVLYEMVTGHAPFSGKTMSDVIVAVLSTHPTPLIAFAPNLPAELERIITKALRKDEEERYQLAKDLGLDLKALKQRLEFEVELERSGEGRRSGAGRRLVTLTAFGVYRRWPKSVKLTDKDTIVLADFTNTTGDSVFDGALRQGLAAQLEQSPFLSLLTDDRIAKTLPLMERPKDAHLTQQLARDICRRTGSKATIEGSISGIGGPYTLSLKAVDCQSGDVRAEVQESAERRDQVLEAMGKAAAKLREKLGESLASVQKYDVPPENVTTGSLEALRAYSQGHRAQTMSGDYKGAVSSFEQATRLDPNFAMAYARLAVVSPCGQPLGRHRSIA